MVIEKNKMDDIKNVKAVIMWVIVGIIVFSSLIGGCSSLNKKVGLEDDNAIEENVENIIERQTGLDIDLTPNSKEECKCQKKS